MDRRAWACVGEIVHGLRAIGVRPILVGGRALAALGSRRVTRDFDFIAAHPGNRLAQTIALFYDRGFELASRLNKAGDVLSTIASRDAAIARSRRNHRTWAYFVNPKTGLRIDLLFDVPVAAAPLARRATRTRIRAHMFDVASRQDLLRLKKMARAERSAPHDIADIRFLAVAREGGGQ